MLSHTATRRYRRSFYGRVIPTCVSNPKLVIFNRPLAAELGLDGEVVEREAAALFSGNELPEDANPIAMAYAGHQFGNFVPRLGDGRAILLGELRGRDGILRDVQLKGAGLTPFSRNGDGRAALGPMLREYLISEAMHALGIPTTRSLAVVDDRRAGVSRRCASRRGAHACRRQPCASRNVRVLRRARR